MADSDKPTPRDLLDQYKAIGSPGSNDGAARLIRLLESLVERDEQRDRQMQELGSRSAGQIRVGAAMAPPPAR